MVKAKNENFEQRLSRLQEIVKALEEDTLPLDQGMAFYKEGMECANVCRTLLEQAKHEVSIWKDGQEKSFEQQNKDAI